MQHSLIVKTAGGFRSFAFVLALLLAPLGVVYAQVSVFELASDGSVAEIQALIDAGASVNSRTDSGSTPLMFAAANNGVDVVRALLAAGAHVNAFNLRGMSPLKYAVRHGNGDIVAALIEAGADVNTKTEWCESATCVASRYTPLHFAGRYDASGEIVRLLLEAGADVNATAQSGDFYPEGWYPGSSEVVSALDLAIRHNPNAEAIRLMSAFGASVSERTSRRSPLEIAAWFANDEVVGAVVEAGARDDSSSALFFAAQYNSNAEVIKELIAAGARSTARTSNYNTPLHFAAAYNTNAEVIRVLIDRGADVNAVDNYFSSALDDAVKYNKSPAVPAIVEMLLLAGANVGEYNADLMDDAEANEALRESDVYWMLNDAYHRR